MTGLLYGIGAGPGDPELITVLGLRLLQAADVIFLPATQAGRSYAGTIVDGYLDRRHQEIRELICPPYRDRAAVIARWAALADDVAAALASGRVGAFVCEGDPSLYSTFLHLREALRTCGPEIEIRTIPGVTSVSAAAAAGDFPLATWDERLLIAPAVYGAADIPALFASAESLALLKPGGALQPLISALQTQGGTIRAVLARRVGRPEQQIFTDIEAMHWAPEDYFTTMLIRRERR
jgi:precorrin-2/cobalt-factor-2 C20-methyltransferase